MIGTLTQQTNDYVEVDGQNNKKYSAKKKSKPHQSAIIHGYFSNTRLIEN